MAYVRYLVDDVSDAVAFYVSKLKDDGVCFRNDIVEMQGRKQIVCSDPSGNVIELFQNM